MPVVTDSFISPDSFPLPIHRFSIEQYHRLGELGVLTPEDKVELLEGWIVKKMNQKPAHGFVVSWLNHWFAKHLPDGWIVRCQLPITLSLSEPEPDLVLVIGACGDFRERHPDGTDCRLVIEVADTSLAKDKAKAGIYATAGIEEYWVVNMVDKFLIRMTQPEGSKYARSSELAKTDSIEIKLGSVSRELELDEILK